VLRTPGRDLPRRRSNRDRARRCGPGGTCEQCSHGTHVTGDVASRGAGAVGSGVAPAADVLAVNVFDRPASGAPSADLASLLAGLDHVAAHAAEQPIVAVNLSLVLATGFWSETCDADPGLAPLGAAVDELAARDVVTVVAAGNGGGADGSDGQLRAPGCLSRALTESSVPAGAAAMSGTSMAAPHVTGALALPEAWRPDAPTTLLAQVVQDAGPTVTSDRGSLPRLDLASVLTRAAGDSIALRRGARMLVRNAATTGAPNRSFVYGRADEVVLVGDWNGDGDDSARVRRGATFHVLNRLVSSTDGSFTYGSPPDQTFSESDGLRDENMKLHPRHRLVGFTSVLVLFGSAPAEADEPPGPDPAVDIDSDREPPPPSGEVTVASDRIPPMRYPVEGPVRYVDTLGACRGDGAPGPTWGQTPSGRSSSPSSRRTTGGSPTPAPTPAAQRATVWPSPTPRAGATYACTSTTTPPGTADGAEPARGRFARDIGLGTKVFAGQFIGYLGTPATPKPPRPTSTSRSGDLSDRHGAGPSYRSFRHGLPAGISPPGAAAGGACTGRPARPR